MATTQRVRAPQSRHNATRKLCLGRRPRLNTPQTRRTVAAVAASGNDEGTPWVDAVPGAIELRSKLVETERALEARARNGGSGGSGGEWESIPGTNGAKAVVPVGAPRGVVHLLGGALLGAYPSASYDILGRLISEYASVVVVATPYELSLDHDALARQAQDDFKQAWDVLRGKYGLPAELPVHRVGHSLGAKLQLLSLCGEMAMENARAGETVLLASVSGDDDDDGVEVSWRPGEDVLRSAPCASLTLLAYNNFSAVDTISLIEEVAAELSQKANLDSGVRFALGAVPMVARMAERAAQSVGVEFTPGPEETMQRARTSFVSPANGVLVMSFEGDKLDNSDEIAREIGMEAKTRRERDVAIGHLAPVALTVDVGKAAAEAAAAAGAGSDAQERARERGSEGGPIKLGDPEAAKKVAAAIATFLL